MPARRERLAAAFVTRELVKEETREEVFSRIFRTASVRIRAGMALSSATVADRVNEHREPRAGLISSNAFLLGVLLPAGWRNWQTHRT